MVRKVGRMKGLYEVARSLTFVNKFALPTQLMIELQTVDSTGLTEIEPARPTGKSARRATAVRRHPNSLYQTPCPQSTTAPPRTHSCTARPVDPRGPSDLTWLSRVWPTRRGGRVRFPRLGLLTSGRQREVRRLCRQGEVCVLLLTQSVRHAISRQVDILETDDRVARDVTP